MKKTIALSLVSLCTLSAFSACPFCKKKETGLLMGQVTMMGNGTVRSWVDLDKDYTPRAVGVTFTETALQNLPEVKPGEMAPEFLVSLPKTKAPLAFDHVSVDWNPRGHEPNGIYDKPHFDFHFYMVEPTERSKITLEGDDLKVCTKPVPPAQMAKGYIQPPGTAIKYMGSHWISPASPELNGKPFTSTLIYGSYNGEVNFIEPMITLATITSKQTVEADFPAPEKPSKPGWYPTHYRLSYNADRAEYTVELTNFVKR